MTSLLRLRRHISPDLLVVSFGGDLQAKPAHVRQGNMRNDSRVFENHLPSGLLAQKQSNQIALDQLVGTEAVDDVLRRVPVIFELLPDNFVFHFYSPKMQWGKCDTWFHQCVTSRFASLICEDFSWTYQNKTARHNSRLTSLGNSAAGPKAGGDLRSRASRSRGRTPIRILCGFAPRSTNSNRQPRSDHHGQHARCVCVRCYLRSIRRDVRRPSDVPVFSISRSTLPPASAKAIGGFLLSVRRSPASEERTRVSNRSSLSQSPCSEHAAREIGQCIHQQRIIVRVNQ